MTRPGIRRRAATGLGLAGAALGVLAGVVQVLVGDQIPTWSGAKAAPGALGGLTVAASLLAGGAALGLRRSWSSLRAQALGTAGLLVPGLLCFSTVGRLWLLPGALLLAAGVLSVEDLRATVTLLTRNWSRVLLVVLGAAELLMAAEAPLLLRVVGAVGGVALVAAGSVARSRGLLLGLVVLGVVPFAVLAWTAVVPVVLLLAAAALAVPLVRSTRSTTAAAPDLSLPRLVET